MEFFTDLRSDLPPFLVLYVLLAVIGGLLLLSIVWRPRWTGFEDKTLWDWLSLLSVPALVAAVTLGFSQTASRQEAARAQEDMLQTYFDRISALVLSAEDQPTRDAIGRAHTRAILLRVDGARVGQVLQFLEDLDLIARYDANAEGLDLSGSELKDLRLPGMDFEDANLAGAELEGSDLRNADFEAALLTGADLKFTDLRGAQFDGADLSGATLDHADLRAADLAGAVGLRPDQLVLACFDETTRFAPSFSPPRRDALACELEDD